jgi:hypothetical protein
MARRMGTEEGRWIVVPHPVSSLDRGTLRALARGVAPWVQAMLERRERGRGVVGRGGKKVEGVEHGVGTE